MGDVLDGYGRQSMGSERSIGQQQQAWLKRCKLLDREPGVWREDKVSASKYATKLRDGWPDLLVGLKSGHGQWFWEASRGSRRLSEWALFLEECEANGVTIYIETHGREYDTANGRDTRSLSEDGVDSAYESSKISGRVHRAVDAAIEEGMPHGATPYGYVRTYTGDKSQRKMTGQEPDPVTAPIVREIFTRLREGESLRRIARNLNEREILTRYGTLWDERKVRGLALNPSYTALRAHEVKGLVTETEGSWTPIVDRETFLRVRAILTDPKRTTTRPGGAKHLLSNIATCAYCGGMMTSTNRYLYSHGARTGERAWQYQCKVKGCVRIMEDDLDQFATAALIAYLSREDNISAFVAPADNDELKTVRADIAAAHQKLAELEQAVMSDQMTVSMAGKIEARVNASLRGLEARERDLTTPDALSDLLGLGNLTSRWDAMTIEAKREVFRLVCSPTMMGVLKVGKREAGKVSAETRTRFVKG